MKRFLTLLSIAAALLAVSCAKEQDGPAEGKAMVTYTIDGPVQVATKAMGIIGSEYTLYYEVRLWDGSALGDALTGEGLSGHKDIAADAWPASVSFDLARGKQYKILFWAQSKTAPEGLYDASNLSAVAIDYSKMAASEEKCDAFYGSDVITPAGATAASATLYRPFALVNLGTSDAAQFHTASGDCTVGDVKVTINGSLANSFNVATGEPGAGVATNFAPNAAPIDAYDAKTLVVGETSFNYLSAVYVLPAGASDVIEVAYDIKDNASAAITSLTVSNVPVHANFRTNITGKLLTGTTTYEISVDQAFAGNTNKVVGPTFADVTALNTYFASMADNSDNGDINPEEVTLETIADGDIITLPAIADDVVIRITGTLATGTLNIAYAASGDKPANLSLFVAQLEKLVANITSTHFTLLAGSHITDTADVHTSGSTFVIEQGAKVGTVNIHQGNAEIAGEVAKVAVPAGASADGDGAPVQVKLEKESAVEQIELKAKSDVVVEQPKDQIDVAATEKKVAVYVKTGADGSTATAQNGGVIYVKADVPCTVTVDGTSEAEDGSAVSSTVIIDSGAAGSTVTAENGGAINLTANGNCEVTSSGSSTPEDPTETRVPSTVTIAEVGTGATVYTETSEGGEVEEAPDAEIHGDVFAYVALNVNTEVQYISLKAAIDAASAGDTIKMTDNSTEKAAITADKSITVDLNEKTVNFADFEVTVPALLFYTEEQGIDVSISNGTLHGDGTVKWIVQYDAHGTLTMEDVVSNCVVANGQSIRIESGIGTLTDLNITTTNGSAGIYYCDSKTSGIATGAVTGCTINQQEASGGNAWWKCGIAISNGAKVTIEDCELTGNAPLFIFTSGGEFTVKDTEFHGLGGDYGAYDIVIESNQQAIPSIGLIYNNCNFSKENPVRMIAEGYPYAMAHYYVNAADDALIINSSADFTFAKAKEWPLLQLGSASGNFIDAGTFNNNPSACLAEEYFATYDSTTQHWTVVSDPGYIFENDVVTIYAAHGLSYVSNNYADFRDAGHNLTIKLSEDIDMTGCPFRSFEVNDYTSADKNLVLFTFDGQNKTITGLEKMLISKTWAGHSSFEVKNLTLKDANIVEDENDANENVGVGAICGWAEASSSCKIINVSLLNSSVIGGHWTGGLVGYATGYDDPDDGPVLEKFTVENCTVERCTIKGKGSVGALVAHAAGNNATLWEVENFTSKDNTLLNTASKTDRTGALIGTLGLTTGISTAYPESKVGVYFTSPLTVSGNTVNGVATDARKIGRKGSSDDDKCYLDNENVVDAWLAN